MDIPVPAIFAISLASTLYDSPRNGTPSLETLWLFLLRLVALLLLRAVYWICIYPYHVSPLRHLPGPKDHHFLLGQTVNQHRSGDPTQPFVSWVRQWPAANMIRYFSLGNSESLLVTGLDAYRQVLVEKPNSFRKPVAFQKMLQPITGKGLVLSEGDEHRFHRRMMGRGSPIDNYFDDQIRTQKDSCIVECVASYSSITLDIIGLAGMGVDFRNLETPSLFHQNMQRIFDLSPLGEVLMLMSAYVPIRLLPLRENRTYKEALADIRRLLRELIRERVREMTTPEGVLLETDRQDILSYMIRTYKMEKAYDEQVILELSLNLLIGGHETSSNALLWATDAMARNPQIQHRLRREIRCMLKDTPDPGFTEIDGLGYLDNFIKEVFRVYSPIVSSPRVAVEDVIISGTRVPKGTTIMILPAVFHMNTSIWGSDAESFNPDRWEHAGRTMDSHAFAPFLHGPHQCIGRVFSEVEFKLLLVELVAKFQFEAVSLDKVALFNPSMALRPKGYKVKISRWLG
ncbi:hypothetical protein CDD80_63 [Ophiocordyceps camponoti-rufipedis]|uniref:Cytochrome P450 n=1 Tax=Ophiocordyceps camponoti-rufipedis TaxID=2004952 RepID=A0A2C5ZFJ8_9HYPO|nr:hypothetical protein CDD80_63 [Ophiocordyceps camponoti-rufipedis]